MKIRNLFRIIALSLVATVAVNGLEAGHFGANKKKKSSKKKVKKHKKNVQTMTTNTNNTTTTSSPLLSMQNMQNSSNINSINDSDLLDQIEKLKGDDALIFAKLILQMLKLLYLTWDRTLLLHTNNSVDYFVDLSIVSILKEQDNLMNALSEQGKQVVMNLDDYFLLISPQLNPFILSVLFETICKLLVYDNNYALLSKEVEKSKGIIGKISYEPFNDDLFEFNKKNGDLFDHILKNKQNLCVEDKIKFSFQSPEVLKTLFKAIKETMFLEGVLKNTIQSASNKKKEAVSSHDTIVLKFGPLCLDLQRKIGDAFFKNSVLTLNATINKKILNFSGETEELLNFFKKVISSISKINTEVMLKYELNMWLDLLMGFYQPQLPGTSLNCKKLEKYLLTLIEYFAKINNLFSSNKSLKLGMSREVYVSFLNEIKSDDGSIELKNVSPIMYTILYYCIYNVLETTATFRPLVRLLIFWKDIVSKKILDLDKVQKEQQQRKNQKKEKKKNKKNKINEIKTEKIEKKIEKDITLDVDFNVFKEKEYISKKCSNNNIEIKEETIAVNPESIFESIEKIVRFNNNMRVLVKDDPNNKNHHIMCYNHRYGGHILFLKGNPQKNSCSMNISFETVLNRYKKEGRNKFHLLPSRIQEYFSEGYFLENVKKDTLKEEFLNMTKEEIDFDDIKLYVSGDNAVDIVIIPGWLLNNVNRFDSMTCEDDIKNGKECGDHEGLYLFIIDHTSKLFIKDFVLNNTNK